MNISLSINRWRNPAQPVAIQRIGLPPEVLRKEGILTDPNKPEQAYLRAKRLVNQGHFREARDLVYPHARTASRALRLKMTELLARCAMVGVGGDWEDLFNTLLHDCAEAGDAPGVARARRDYGEMLLNVGRLQESDRQLRDASIAFMRLNDPGRGAMVECLRARVRLRVGYVTRALQRVDRAITTLSKLNEPRSLALARLDRARVHAFRGAPDAAARDLIAAEHFLGASGSAFDRIRARLTRGECLLLVGQPARASQGLRRILADVVTLEEVPIRAWVHCLLGRALVEVNSPSARGFLMRARHLYAQLGYEYHVAECEIALARAEHRVGLNAQSRLKQLQRRSFSDWPRLAAKRHIARAEVVGERDPERARFALFKARSFATESGDRSLLAEIDSTLRHSGLVDETEVDNMTPIEGPDANAMIVAGYCTVPDGLAPAPVNKPVPFQIYDAVDDRPSTTPWPRQSVRRVTPSVPQGAGVILKPPKAVGVCAQSATREASS